MSLECPREYAPAADRLPLAAPSVLKSSPSSETTSAMCEDMMLGAGFESDVGNGVEKELLVREWLRDAIVMIFNPV